MPLAVTPRFDVRFQVIRTDLSRFPRHVVQLPKGLALQNARTLKSLQWFLVLLVVVLVVAIKRGW